MKKPEILGEIYLSPEQIYCHPFTSNITCLV